MYGTMCSSYVLTQVICHLWRNLLKDSETALPSKVGPLTQKATQLPCVMSSVRYGKSYRDSDLSFNAGLWGMNFDLWREQQMPEEVKYWIEQVSQSPDLHPEPIILCILAVLLYSFSARPAGSLAFRNTTYSSSAST